MAAKETVELALRARLDDLRKELGKVPGITSKEAKAMAKGLEKEIKAAERAASQAAEATKSKWGKALGAISFAAVVAGAKRAAEAVFRTVDAVAEFRQEVAQASKTTGLAAETIAGMRLAADSAGVSFEEVRKAVKDPSELQAFVDLAREFGTDVGPEAMESAKEWKSSLAELQMVFQDTAAELADFLDASGALRAFTTGFLFAKEFVVAALDEMATRGADSLKILQLALKGDWQELAILGQKYRETGSVTDEAWKKAEKAAQEFYELGQATRALEVPLADVGETTEHTTKKLEDTTKVLREQHDATEQLRDIATEAQSDQLSGEEKIRAALDEKILKVLELATVSQDYGLVVETVAALEERAVRDINALREKTAAEEQERIDELAEANHKALEEQKEDLREVLMFWSEIFSEIAKVFDALQDVLAFTREGVEEKIALYEKELAALEAGQEAQVDGAKAAATEGVEITRSETRAQASLRETLREQRAEALRAELEETKKQALRLWAAEQAAAISSVVFNTAGAIMAAFAQLGPIAGAIAAGVVGAAGAVQIGTILREKPPKYHSGLVPALGPTEVPAILDRHEGVANRRAMSTPGFRDALEQANHGVLPDGGGGATVVYLNDRVLDVVVARGLQGRGAKLEARRIVAGAGSRRRRGGYG